MIGYKKKKYIIWHELKFILNFINIKSPSSHFHLKILGKQCFLPRRATTGLQKLFLLHLHSFD